MARFDLVYDGYASLNGTPDHLVPRLDPSRLCDADHGLSGTEVHLFGTAFELARRGHRVTLFSKWTATGDLMINPRTGASVRFEDVATPSSGCDVAIAYHDGRPLDRWSGCRKAAHHQTFDLSPPEQSRDFAELYFTATHVVALHHARVSGREFRVVPNAWNLGDFHEWHPVKGRLVWTTGVERGFHRLMEALPAIVERVPEAHVVAFSRGGPDGLEKARALARPFGDRVAFAPTSSRNYVLRDLANAACFAYPCDPPRPCECWPMSVTDALATGVPVVLAPDDGIDVLFSGGVLPTLGIKLHPDKWLEFFVEAVSTVLSSDLLANRASHMALGWVRPHTFARSVDALLGHLSDSGWI